MLVGLAVLGGVALALHPSATSLDRWWFSAIPRNPNQWVLVRVVKFGDPLVLVFGTLLATVLAARWDRLRALACLAGPPLAAVLVELALKPLVGRYFEGVLTYPSGNVTTVAAVATALALATRGRVRIATIVVGSVVTLAMAVAVIGLRWHFPTDAAGGLLLGPGVVLLVDGVVHRPELAQWVPPVLRTRSSALSGRDVPGSG